MQHLGPLMRQMALLLCQCGEVLRMEQATVSWELCADLGLRFFWCPVLKPLLEAVPGGVHEAA